MPTWPSDPDESERGQLEGGNGDVNRKERRGGRDRTTGARLAAGQETLHDWDDVKARLLVPLA